MDMFHKQVNVACSLALPLACPSRTDPVWGGAGLVVRGGVELGQRLGSRPQASTWRSTGSPLKHRELPLGTEPATRALAEVARGPALPLGTTKNSTPSPVMIGPWGGRGGTPRDIRKGSGHWPQHLESITIRSTDSYGGRINGFSFIYVDNKGQSIPVGTWGSATKGYEETITMGPVEYVNHVSGTADQSGVTSLAFVTNKGVHYGTYGFPSGTPFSLLLQQGNGEVLGFFGRAGDCLIALGAYVSVRAD